MSNVGSSINNSTNLLSPSIENNTNSNENNTNSLVASNAINEFEDNLDNVFGVNLLDNNNTGISNTGISNTGISNIGINNTGISNTSVSNIIQSNNVQSNQNSSVDSLNNTLLNNNSDFEIFDNGTPLSEFDNSNKNSNSNVNQNIIKAPNRKLGNNNNNNNVVNTNVEPSDPINNIVNISNNINSNLSNSNSNVDSILKDGLLETSSNSSDTQEFYYLDSNNNTNINSNINTNAVNLKDIDVSNTNVDSNNVKISDNFVLEFPARMSDGRQFTDYKSNGFLNLHEQELKNTLEYRLYLQNNAETIMDNNYNIIASINNCSDCPGYQIVDTKSLLTCSKESCIQELKDDSGLGFDIQYVVA